MNPDEARLDQIDAELESLADCDHEDGWCVCDWRAQLLAERDRRLGGRPRVKIRFLPGVLVLRAPGVSVMGHA